MARKRGLRSIRIAKMSDGHVRRLLFLAILIVTVLPLSAALYFLDNSLKTSLSLGFSAQVTQALNEGSDNLKALRLLDPQRQDDYRRQFESLQQLRHVYSNPEVVRRSILDSLRIYFAGGLVLAVLFSVVMAGLLSRRIAQAYKQTFDELTQQREKVRYLQEISAWQEMAKLLAHEIKNPLTPIELLVSSLAQSHRTLSTTEFSGRLQQTQAMIAEELLHLKRTVNKFSDFARLPEVQLSDMDLQAVLPDIVKAIAATCADATIEVRFADPAPIVIALDVTLFRQALTNIVRNGIEANPGRRVSFQVRVGRLSEAVEICLGNDGAPVAENVAARMFDPYVSTKSGPDNMGLGLAIVRKIVLDHGGDIRYETAEQHPVFRMVLPARHGY